MKHFRDGQAVIVNTGGEDSRGIIKWAKDPNRNPALKDSVCVAFKNGTSQWIPKEYVREEEQT